MRREAGGFVAKLVIFFNFCKEFGKFLLSLQDEMEEDLIVLLIYDCITPF